MTDPDSHEDLKVCFERVSRGRPVSVGEKQNSMLGWDYEVATAEEGSRFEVRFTTGGHFEGAYRCIERWIAAKAGELDGESPSLPADCLDLRKEIRYWMLERAYDSVVKDLREAISNRSRQIEAEMAKEHTIHEVSSDFRLQALQRLLTYLDEISQEVHSAVLSPKAIQFLRLIGIPLEERARS